MGAWRISNSPIDRVERTSSRAGFTPAVDHHLSRRTRFADITGHFLPILWVSYWRMTSREMSFHMERQTRSPRS